MAGTSGGGIPGSLMFTAGFDFSKAEAQATADVDKIIDKLQKQLDKKKLSVKLDFCATGDLGEVTTKIRTVLEEIKKAKKEFDELSKTPTGGSIGSTTELERTATQLGLLTFKLNEYIAKLDEVAKKRRTSASASTSADDKAIAKAQEKVRILNAEENSIGAVQAKLKLYNQQLLRSAEGSKAWDYTTTQIQRLNSTLDQLKAKAKEATMSDAEQERILLKEIEKEEKARVRQLAAREKLVQKGQQLVRALQAEETSLNAVATKIRMYEGLLRKSAEGSNAWNNAVAQIRRLSAAYDDLKTKMQLALVSAVNSISNLNSQLGIYTGRLNSLEIGSSQWKTMALRIREVSNELTVAQQHLADFQAKAFQGLSGNMTKNQVAELQRLRAEIDAIDAKVNRAYQGALSSGSPDAMKVAMVDINRALDERMRKEEQINKILTSSADLQLQRQKQLTAEVEKRNRIEAQKKEGARRVAILKGEERSIAGINAKLQIYNELLQKAKPNTAGYDWLIQQVDRLTTKLSLAQQRMDTLTGKTTEGANKQAASMGKVNAEMQRQHGYLERLIRRMAVYASIGAVGGFLTKIREVTAQFELQRVSLGAIIQDQNRANQLFSEIKQFALKSPVKILDLTKYVKQVAAYRIETDKLFDTTKRLADVSVGLGVDMQRIVLAYGQVKAASYLRAAEVRQFTEAGIPLLELLAEKFSKLNGEMVTTEQVMDMISKRGVGFEMVEDIFKDMTDAGGIFYNMQEKQGNTLYGMWQKLGDAASVMYDKIGNTESVNGALKGTIRLMTDLMRNWKATRAALTAIGGLMGGALLLKQASKTGGNVKDNADAKVVKTAELRRIAEERLTEAKLKGSAADKKAAKDALAKAQADEKAALSEQKRAHGMSKLALGLKQIGSSLLTGLGIGAVIAGITALVYELKKAYDAAHAVENEFNKIRSETPYLKVQGVDNFIRLAEAAVHAANGSKAQKDALDELQRSFKDMIPEEQLSIENLAKLRAGAEDASIAYKSLTDSVEHYIAAQQKQKEQDFIGEHYGQIIQDMQQRLRDNLVKDSFMNDAEIARLWVAFQKTSKDTSKTVKENFIEACKQAGLQGGERFGENFEKAWEKVEGVGKSFWSQNPKYAGGFKVDDATYQELIKTETAIGALADAHANYATQMQASEEAYRGQLGLLPIYTQELQRLDENIANMKPSDSLVEDMRNINTQIVDMMLSMVTQFQLAGMEFKDEWVDIVTIVDNNDLGNITKIQFDKIIESLEALDPNKYPGLAAFIKFIEKLRDRYNDLVPSSIVVNQIRQRFFQIEQAFRGNSKELRNYMMGVNETVEAYSARLKTSIQALKADLVAMTQALKIALVNKAMGDAAILQKSIEETENTIAALEKLFNEVDKYVYHEPKKTKTSKKSSKSKSEDPRLQNLQEIWSTLKEINKEYDELYKKEGMENAIGSLNEGWYNTLQMLKSLNDKYKFKIDFKANYPTSFEELYNYGVDIYKAMKEMKNAPKGMEKAILEMERELSRLWTDNTQKDIEKQLKILSDKIAQSKAAKEFYDNILSQTGNIELAASVTMSLYGDIGESLVDFEKQLNEQLVKEIQEIVQPYQGRNSFWFSGQAINMETFDIDYSALLHEVQDFVNMLGGLESSAYQKLLKIANEGVKNVNKQILDWNKTYSKVKTIQEKITDVIRTETAERNKIIKTVKDETMRNQLLQLSYDMQNQKIADLQVDEFKESSFYVEMFEDLSTQATDALYRMREAIEGVLKSESDMSPENMKAMVKALQDINDEIDNRKLFDDWSLGFKGLFNSVKEVRMAQDELATVKAKADEERIALQKEYDTALGLQINKENELEKLKNAEVQDCAAIAAKQLEVNAAMERTALASQKLAQNTKKVSDAQNKVAKKQKASNLQLQKMMTTAQKIQQFISGIQTISEGLEYIFGDITSEATAWGNTLNASLEALSQFQAAMEICIVLQQAFNLTTESNPWFALAAAILAVTVGLAKFISDQKVAKANKEIEKQDKILHDLEYTYSRLQNAQDKLFGAEYIANYREQMQMLYAEAEAYRKQAEAEKSKGKRMNKDEYQDYMDSYRDTMDEIYDMQGQIQERMLGTDLTSAARDFANAWLEAKWSFEDTTEAMREKFADMVQNMIVESMAAKLMESILSPVYEMIDKAAIDGQITAEEIAEVAEKGFAAIGTMNNAMETLLAQMEEAGLNVSEMLGDGEDNMTGIARDIATASEESINGLAQGINTQNYYISHVPTISENVMAIRLLMEGGAGVSLGASGDYVTLQNEHLAQLPVIAQNTLATAERCERAALACEEMADNIRRVVTYKGADARLNVQLN